MYMYSTIEIDKKGLFFLSFLLSYTSALMEIYFISDEFIFYILKRILLTIELKRMKLLLIKIKQFGKISILVSFLNSVLQYMFIM